MEPGPWAAEPWLVVPLQTLAVPWSEASSSLGMAYRLLAAALGAEEVELAVAHPQDEKSHWQDRARPKWP